jgi:hypothetical protein
VTELREHLTDALTALDWLSSVPHHLDHLVSLNEQWNNERGSSGGSSDGRRAKGSHSDPTARAVLGPDDDGTTEQIDHSLGLVLTGSHQLVTTIEAWGYIEPKPRALPDRRALRLQVCGVNIAACVPHVDHLARELRGDDLVWLRSTVRDEITEPAQWLLAKGDAIWSAAKGEDRDAPVQRKRIECSSCARWGLHTDVSEGQLCARCAYFRRTYKCAPTEAICREWDRHGDRARITPSMIGEAKAPSRKATKRAAS